MPKGSKKRRAERRKKENEVYIHSPPNGSEDLKSNTTGSLSVESSTSVDNKKIDGSEISRDSKEQEVVCISNDLESQEEKEKLVVIEGDSDSRLIPIDSVKKSGFISSSSGSGNSSGSSSDEESHSIDKKEDEFNLVEKKEDCCDSVPISSPQFYLTEQVVGSSISEDVNRIVEVTSAVKAEKSSLTDLPSKDVLTIIDASIIETDNGGRHRRVTIRTPEIETGNDVGDHQETMKTSEISDKQQQQGTPALPPLQPTSWKSCCGLFDVFMGSNR